MIFTCAPGVNGDATGVLVGEEGEGEVEVEVVGAGAGAAAGEEEGVEVVTEGVFSPVLIRVVLSSGTSCTFGSVGVWLKKSMTGTSGSISLSCAAGLT
jgi:hypothetical protein